MSDKKLSLHIGEKNSVTSSSGFNDQIDPQSLTVGGLAWGGSGGGTALSKRLPGYQGSGDVIFNDSITRDATGHQTSNKDPDTYWLA